jgi:hypothetical protein
MKPLLDIIELFQALALFLPPGSGTLLNAHVPLPSLQMSLVDCIFLSTTYVIQKY